MMHLQIAYEGVSPIEIKDSIREGQRLSISPDIPPDLSEIIKRCWDKNPRARPTFQEVVASLKAILMAIGAEQVAVKSLDLTTSMNSPLSASPPALPNELQTKRMKIDPPFSRNSWFCNLKSRKMFIIVIILVSLVVIGIIVGVFVGVSSNKGNSIGNNTVGSSEQIPTTFSTPTTSSTPIATPKNLVVSTFAGTGERGTVNGTRLSSTFGDLVDIIVDAYDNIYLSDSLEHTIRKIDTNGQVSTIAGVPGNAGHKDGPSLSAEFYSPRGICFRADGSLIVSDEDNSVIRAISPDFLTVSTIAGTGVAGATNHPMGMNASFKLPKGIACDSYGNIYVADYGNHLV